MDDVVTKIQAGKKGALVTVNEEEILWVSRAIFCERELHEGDEMDLAEYKSWLLPRQYPGALNYAVSLLAGRDHSCGEIEKKLKLRRYLPDTIEMVVYKLEKEQLLDDERFARQWAEARAQKQLGKYRIIQELRMKGVDSQIAQRAVAELDGEDGDEQAYLLASRLLQRYANDEPRKAMNKMVAAMARRGYGFDDAKQAISRALREAEMEPEEDFD